MREEHPNLSSFGSIVLEFARYLDDNHQLGNSFANEAHVFLSQRKLGIPEIVSSQTARERGLEQYTHALDDAVMFYKTQWGSVTWREWCDLEAARIAPGVVVVRSGSKRSLWGPRIRRENGFRRKRAPA